MLIMGALTGWMARTHEGAVLVGHCGLSGCCYHGGTRRKEAQPPRKGLFGHCGLTGNRDLVVGIDKQRVEVIFNSLEGLLHALRLGLG